jgi:hypothetical protein
MEEVEQALSGRPNNLFDKMSVWTAIDSRSYRDNSLCACKTTFQVVQGALSAFEDRKDHMVATSSRRLRLEKCHLPQIPHILDGNLKNERLCLEENMALVTFTHQVQYWARFRSFLTISCNLLNGRTAKNAFPIGMHTIPIKKSGNRSIVFANTGKKTSQSRITA